MDTQTLFSFSADRRGRCVVVVPVGELDVHTVPAFTKAMTAFIAAEERYVAIAADGLAFIDSDGVRCLSQLHTGLKGNGGGLLWLGTIPGSIRRPIDLLGWNWLLAHHFSSIEEAMQAVN